MQLTCKPKNILKALEYLDFLRSKYVSINVSTRDVYLVHRNPLFNELGQNTLFKWET